jgi:zinc D-Ala-D-Ala carboxypeptidase
MQLSDHFTLEEFVISESAQRLGIDNTPSQVVIDFLVFTAKQMEMVRNLLAQPIHINSGYRSPELNKAIGGVPTSQHCLGQACDFICPAFGTPLQICRLMVTNWNSLQYDQLIFEFDSWTHISFVKNGVPRGSVLTINKAGTVQGLPGV